MSAIILGWLAHHWLLIAALVFATAVWANPVLVWKLKAWILLAVVLWWGWTGHMAYNALLEKTDHAAAEYLIEIDNATYVASEAARREEQTLADAVNVVDKAYQRGLTNGKAAADRVLADRDAGRLVLRDKFKCPAQRGPAQAAAGTGSGDGQEGAVLSVEDQDFLVRLATEADDNVRQLTACQAVIEADRSTQADGLHASRPGN
jgi:hypothetical protein